MGLGQGQVEDLAGPVQLFLSLADQGDLSAEDQRYCLEGMGVGVEETVGLARDGRDLRETLFAQLEELLL